MQHYNPDHPAQNTLIPKHGGYRKLKSFQLAQLVYDFTALFCSQHIDRRSRTHDQMVQAARSGVQNIAEGSQASGTSRKFEIKLTNVARASLEELRLDYQDFLRQRGLTEWPRGDFRRDDLIARRFDTAAEVAAWAAAQCGGGDGRGGPLGRLGQGGHGGPASKWSTPSTLSKPSTPWKPAPAPPPGYPEAAANAALVLINVACALLSRQINAQAAAFETQGGFTERLYNARKRKAF